MNKSKEFKLIRCGLCMKDKKFYHQFTTWTNEIQEGSEVCVECRKQWERGRKVSQSSKTDGKVIPARVVLVIESDGRDVDPKKNSIIKAADVAAAMGAVSLRGTSMNSKWHGVSEMTIGRPEESYSSGGSQIVEVPKGRAEAMKRIIDAFFSATAKARVEGFNDGRDLIKGLATGSVQPDEFTEKSDNARAGKRQERW